MVTCIEDSTNDTFVNVKKGERNFLYTIFSLILSPVKCKHACWLLKTASYRVCTSVLSIWLKHILWFFVKEYVTILIAFSFLSEFLGNSIFMHLRGRATYDQISAVRVNGNKHVYQLQTGLVSYMILKLHGNENRNSCDQRFFFSQHFERKSGKKLGKKKKPLAPRVYFKKVLQLNCKTQLMEHDALNQ